MEAFARLLHTAIGLDAASIGMTSIERAVLQRMAACRLADPEAYLEHLKERPEEMQALVETIVVPETWFFRDPKAFGLAADHARASRPPSCIFFASLVRPARSPTRWPWPCSTPRSLQIVFTSTRST